MNTQNLLKLDTLVDFSPRNELERRVRSIVFQAKEDFLRVDGPIMDGITTVHGEYPVFITFNHASEQFRIQAFKGTHDRVYVTRNPVRGDSLDLIEGHGPTLFDAVLAFRKEVANES